jgi:phosphoserine phosphatase RsbU/P
MDTSEEYADFLEELFEDAPCGYLATRLDGTIVRVNRTFEQWTGHDRAQLLSQTRFQELLSPGGRIYHETHYAPLLQMQGSVREIAVEIVRADGSRLPALVNSTIQDRGPGREPVVRTIIFDATGRRGYEEELLRARRREREIVEQLQESLLAGDLPHAPGLEIEAFYQAAVAGLDVGGDWYDAFWLDEGRRVALVVGDVVGRGIGAAATMGQLRSAIRGLASTGLRPGPLLDALDT